MLPGYATWQDEDYIGRASWLNPESMGRSFALPLGMKRLLRDKCMHVLFSSLT